MVGVLVITIFLFQKVLVLSIAKFNGSPSPPTSLLNLSTSSASRILKGLLDNSAAELLPTNVIYPPTNSFCSLVSLPSTLFRILFLS